MTLEFSQQVLEKCSHIKLHEYPSRGKRVVPRERTDMTKLTVGFRNFANAPKNRSLLMIFLSQTYCNWYHSLECLHRGSSLWNNVAALSNFKYLWNIIRHTVVQNRAKLLTILMPTGTPSLASCASTWLPASGGGGAKSLLTNLYLSPFRSNFSVRPRVFGLYIETDT
jgi:hypothetical protein